MELQIGDIVEYENNTYRLIGLIESNVIFCKINTTKLLISIHNVQNLLTDLSNGRCKIKEPEKGIIIVETTLSIALQKKLNLYRSIIKRIDSEFGPTYTELSGHKNKKAVETILNEFHISRPTFWRSIRAYLQSGFNINAILDGRHYGKHYERTIRKKPLGRKIEEEIFDKNGNKVSVKYETFMPGPDDFEYMEKALKNYLDKKALSLAAAWDQMNYFHYSNYVQEGGKMKVVLYDAQHRPSLRMFRYYVRKHTTTQQLEIARTSAMEFRNNCRILKSDTRNGVMGPGQICEVDEVEFDCYIVDSETRTKNIGKAIGYCMIDVDTRQIIAFETQLDNNAFLGITNCFLNLADDKVAYCKQFGIEIKPDDWISYLPENIRSDQGSEYVGNQFKRLCTENNITPQLVSPASGSLKPLVEQSFHQIMSRQYTELQSLGWYKKKYGDMCRKEACLTIEDFTKLVIHFVLEHNKTYMKGYRRTSDQRKAGMLPIPNEIYKTDCLKFGYPRKIVNFDQFYYSVMYADKASVTRNGIIYKDLVYYDENINDLNQKIYDAQGKRKPIDIRIDPRDVYAIFYLDGKGNYIKVPINKNITGNDFAGYTLQEYEEIRKERKDLDRQGKILNENLRADRLNKDIQVIKEINSKAFACTQNIKENREAARQKFNNENSIRNRIEPVSAQKSDREYTKNPINELSEAASADNTIKESQTVNRPAPVKNQTIKEINQMINYGPKGGYND